MNEYSVLIATANTATLLTGGAVAVLAYRAFRRIGTGPLRAVAVGFGLLVAGSVLGGAIHLVAGRIALGVAVQSSFTAGGCGVLLYSLYAETPTRTVTVRKSP
jgi:hypothetical protein